jgi:hypothetical protein
MWRRTSGGLADDIVAGNRGRSRRRRKQRCQHLDERTLARTIRADQAENLALIDRQRHLIDGRQIAEFSSERGSLYSSIVTWSVRLVVRHEHESSRAPVISNTGASTAAIRSLTSRSSVFPAPFWEPAGARISDTLR